MLKRLYSKRSGFTLVEIIVAVAIFAIMATAIASILQMSLTQRQKNTAYGKELANQENQLARVKKDGNDYDTTLTDSDKYGDYAMLFIDSAGTEYDTKLAYAAMDADSNKSTEGINYFVSPVKYDGKAPTIKTGSSGSPGGAPVGAPGGDEASDFIPNTATVDIRLMASRGMNYVKVLSVEKIGEPVSGAAVRYVFKTCASSAGMNKQDMGLAEYKLFFYTDTVDNEQYEYEHTGVKSDGSEGTYHKKVYEPAVIKEVGYSDDSGSPAPYQTGKPVVESTTGSNTVLVRVPQGKEGGHVNPNDNYSGDGFSSSVITTFYVDFEENIDLAVNSFGSNGIIESDGCKYTNSPIAVSSGTYTNIFAYGYKYFDIEWVA